AVKEFFHRRVPRQIEEAAGWAQRVEAVSAEFEADRRGRVTQCRQVTPGYLDELTERSGGGGAGLAAPARLGPGRGTGRERAGGRGRKGGGLIRSGRGCPPRGTFGAGVGF